MLGKRQLGPSGNTGEGRLGRLLMMVVASPGWRTGARLPGPASNSAPGSASGTLLRSEWNVEAATSSGSGAVVTDTASIARAACVSKLASLEPSPYSGERIFGRGLAGHPVRPLHKLLLCWVLVEPGIGIHIIFRIDRNLSPGPQVDSWSEPVHLVITHWFILRYRSGLQNLQVVCLVPLVWVDHFRVH